MSNDDFTHPRVFISYSHETREHDDRVLSLSDRLRADGIDCILDQYEFSPPEGFPRWMDRQIKNSDFVLMICTLTYSRRVMGEEEIPSKGLGVKWESSAIYQYIYNDGTMNTRFIPILFEENADLKDIPTPWQSATYYRPMTEAGYEDLYRRLTNQPRTPKTELGKLRELPARERKYDFFKNEPEATEALSHTFSIVEGKRFASSSIGGISIQNIPFCPYRGLYPFRERDETFFFGRDSFTEQLISGVRRKPLVAVVGPSGSGKSSIIFAGLLPRLRREGSWHIASFRPRDRPFHSLAAALIPILEPQMSETELLMETTKLADILQKGKLSLYDIVEHIMHKLDASRFLILIDQFEELYTLFHNAKDRQCFLDTLLRAIQTAASHQRLSFTLVLALRADFFGQVLLYRPFADALQHADLKLSSMNFQELREAIERPSTQLNVKIEEGLIERILEEVSQEPGNLPLLEFTLTQLWEKQQWNKLTHDAYNDIGGVKRSLAAYAESMYLRLNEKEQQFARQILVQLVNPGKGTEDTRRIATRDQVGDERWNLVIYLSDARLVVCGRDEVTGEDTVEIVHEALIGSWERLRNWMEEDREFRLWQERLRTRISEWERTNYSETELLRGILLIEAENWIKGRTTELSQAEQDFIQESQKQQEREKQLKHQQHRSVVFTASMKLSELVEDIYRFVTSVVEISSMLLTLYDRDLNKVYDVFAISNGKRFEELLSSPVITTPENRPMWLRVAQEETEPLQLTLDDRNIREYEELLLGTWGDQRKAKSFLLLTLKTPTSVIGPLSLTSMHANAFRTEEKDVLEAMVQSATISIENAKLYDRSQQALREAKRREELLATMNNASQEIIMVLNINELQYKFVEKFAKLVQAEICIFFQLSPQSEEIVARAFFESEGNWDKSTQSNSSVQDPYNVSRLLEKIRIPFKGSILSQLSENLYFYLDAGLVEELAKACEEGGTIFLREAQIERMLMIPVRYQTEIVGILALYTPRQNRVFRPEEVDALLVICGQAASAIRNAQLLEQLQEAYAELQRMDKLKDDFLMTASHELRTPLSAISGYVSLLKRQSGRITPQQILRFATKIASATQQLSDLVSNMTEAAKMGTLDKKLELQTGPVQLLTAAEMASTMLSINIEQKITLQIAEDIWLNCDAMRLRQVITNLLDNAAKYSPPGGLIIVTGSATTLLQLPEDQIDYTLLADGIDPQVALVRVCDEGEGIDPEDQQKIFERFVRASRSLTTPIRGSGLGLYICHRYIEAMSGRIWLEQSIPGEGSIFSFYLPRIEAPIEKSEEDYLLEE